MTAEAFGRLDAMFSNEFSHQQGGAAQTKRSSPKSKKSVQKSDKKVMKGGFSQASNAVLQHVQPSAYVAMESSMAGGAKKKAVVAKKKAAAKKAAKPAGAAAANNNKKGNGKAQQRGGSLSSDAVLSHMTSDAFAGLEANLSGVLPPAQAGGASRARADKKLSLIDKIKKSIAEMVDKTVKKTAAATAKKPAAPSAEKKKRAPMTKQVVKDKKKGKSRPRSQRGGANTCDSSNEPLQQSALFTMETSKVPVASAVDSETQFSSCEFKDVLQAPSAVMGPRYDYTLLPQFDGSPFTLPIPGDWISNFTQI